MPEDFRTFLAHALVVQERAAEDLELGGRVGDVGACAVAILMLGDLLGFFGGERAVGLSWSWSQGRGAGLERGTGGGTTVPSIGTQTARMVNQRNSFWQQPCRFGTESVCATESGAIDGNSSEAGRDQMGANNQDHAERVLSTQPRERLRKEHDVDTENGRGRAVAIARWSVQDVRR